MTMRFDGGPSGICQDGPDGSHEVTGYLNVFAHSYDQCYALAKVIKKQLHGYKGIVSGLNVQRISCNDPSDLSDKDGLAQDPPIYRQMLELEVNYLE